MRYTSWRTTTPRSTKPRPRSAERKLNGCAPRKNALYGNNKQKIEGIIVEIRVSNNDFNLTHTFECGQCFRWNRNPDGS
ncbi:MAG: DNA glycosylase, partial [Clostridia bacterium]